PYSLTGIVLTGANQPVNALGQREGILTAQEIAQLDLSACHLATLSACDSSLGVRQAGSGLASLRQSLHAAGARYVLATLWKVDDKIAADLMTDFYTRLWQQGQDPHAALRAAKAKAMKSGSPFRDWAGWALTGQ
nr:CHAT domain-containing protein [Planctomycetota bacterium]